MTSRNGTVIQWNGDGKPSSVGNIGFTYDGVGVRLKKVSGGQTTKYIGGDYEIAPDGTVTKYLRGGKKVGAAFFVHHRDHLGSIQAVTDSAGNEVRRQKHKPFGDQHYVSGSHAESKGWIGEREEETELLYLNARYYDPEIGRFTAPDPIVGLGQRLNRYSYALSTPANLADPSGLLPDNGRMGSDENRGPGQGNLSGILPVCQADANSAECQQALARHEHVAQMMAERAERGRQIRANAFYSIQIGIWGPQPSQTQGIYSDPLFALSPAASAFLGAAHARTQQQRMRALVNESRNPSLGVTLLGRPFTISFDQRIGLSDYEALKATFLATVALINSGASNLSEQQRRLAGNVNSITILWQGIPLNSYTSAGVWGDGTFQIHQTQVLQSANPAEWWAANIFHEGTHVQLGTTVDGHLTEPVASVNGFLAARALGFSSGTVNGLWAQTTDALSLNHRLHWWHESP
jgi:RHS repeat-associated protein